MNPDKQSIEQAAAEWLVELHDDAGDSDDVVRRFLQWLDASPRHLQVFAELGETFDLLGDIDPQHRSDTKAESAAPKIVMLRPDRRPVREPENMEETSDRKQTDPCDERGMKPESEQAKFESAAFSRLLAGIAGYDLKLLEEYAGHEREHERKKLIRIGACVVIPAVLSLFTAFFFVDSLIASFMVKGIVTLVVALVILLIDCSIVASLPRNAGSGIILRVIVSLCMGMVLVEPLTLALNRDSIDARIDSVKAGRRFQQAAYENELSLRRHEEDEVRKRVAALQIELATAQAALELARVQLHREAIGEGPSRLKGMGSDYRQIQDHLSSLRERRDEISRRIGNVEKEIAAARADGAEVRTQKAIADLQQTSAIGAADNTVSRVLVLYEVIGENPLLLVKPLALILLLFLVDLTPIIVKLTIRTEYDEYLKTLISARHRIMAALRERHRQSLIALGSRRIRGLVDFGQTTHRALVLCSPEGLESTYARAILSRVERTIGDQAEDLLAKATDCETSRRERARPADSVSLFRCWMELVSGRRHASCR